MEDNFNELKYSTAIETCKNAKYCGECRFYSVTLGDCIFVNTPMGKALVNEKVKLLYGEHKRNLEV